MSRPCDEGDAFWAIQRPPPGTSSANNAASVVASSQIRRRYRVRMSLGRAVTSPESPLVASPSFRSDLPLTVDTTPFRRCSMTIRPRPATSAAVAATLPPPNPPPPHLPTAMVLARAVMARLRPSAPESHQKLPVSTTASTGDDEPFSVDPHVVGRQEGYPILRDFVPLRSIYYSNG